MYADKKDKHNFYNSIKSVYGPQNCSVKTADSFTLLKNQNRILLKWAKHFDALLNQDHTILGELPERLPVHDLCQPPTFMEVLTTVRALKNNKSPGIDNIPAKLLKEGGYLCTRTHYQYILGAWEKESIPQVWKDVNIVTIYKNKSKLWQQQEDSTSFCCRQGTGQGDAAEADQYHHRTNATQVTVWV